MEIADKDPWFVEGLRYTGEQIKVHFLPLLFQITLGKTVITGRMLGAKASPKRDDW